MKALRRLQHVSSPYPPGKENDVRKFYGEVLGLSEIASPSSLEYMRLIWFSAGPGDLEMHFFPGQPDPEHPRHFCLEVDDLEAMRHRLQNIGCNPYDDVPIPNRPRFFCRDPFGNLLEFTTITGTYD